MNQTEAASIVAYLNRAGLVWAMEGQAAVWADALSDVSFVTAQEVVRNMAATRTSGGRSVTPGDVREEVRVIRHARLRDIKSPEPPEQLDGNPTRENAWRLAYVRLIGDGMTEAEADARACEEHGVTRAQLDAAPRPVLAVIEGHKARCSCGCLTRPISKHERTERKPS